MYIISGFVYEPSMLCFIGIKLVNGLGRRRILFFRLWRLMDHQHCSERNLAEFISESIKEVVTEMKKDFEKERY